MSVDCNPLLDQFAPSGRIRAALNHGNRVLVSRDASGVPFGITVDLAAAVAKALDLPLDFVSYERAADVSSSAESDVWDICFLAVDPERAKTIDFTEPYVSIEGRYLAAADTSYRSAEDLVAAGARVGSVVGSAYSLTLLRRSGAENLVMYEDIVAMLAAFDAGKVDAVAGIGNVMEAEAAMRPGTRVLAQPFMEILQAMAMPRGRPQASARLKAILAELARTGRVGDILERHGVSRACAIVPA